MPVIIVFDLRRISTVVAPTGKIHITELGGMRTVCGIILRDGVLRKGHFRTGRMDWGENHEDRQPQCLHCIREATRWPTRYAFHKLVQPL